MWNGLSENLKIFFVARAPVGSNGTQVYQYVADWIPRQPVSEHHDWAKPKHPHWPGNSYPQQKQGEGTERTPSAWEKSLWNVINLSSSSDSSSDFVVVLRKRPALHPQAVKIDGVIEWRKPIWPPSPARYDEKHR